LCAIWLGSPGVLGAVGHGSPDQTPSDLPGDVALRVGEELILVTADAVPAEEASLTDRLEAERPTTPAPPDAERDYEQARRRLARTPLGPPPG
jgi:hypothetical protein